MTLPWIITMAAGVLVVVFGVIIVFFDDDKAMAAIIAVPLAGIAFCIPMMINAQHAYERWCRAQGGHTDTHSESTVVTTVNGSGQPGVGVGSTSTTYCLTSDGRIIDIQ
jgi:hypothetical protein